MKFFVDTADVKEIKELHQLGLVDGVTTNPSLILKSGGKITEVTKQICDIVEGPVSAEVVATEFPQITFRLDGYQPGGQGAVANGSLTILDRTQPVSVPLTLTPGAGGVQIQGVLPLDMTTYGVEPPVVMMGLLRVRPQIRIEFTGVVTP